MEVGWDSVTAGFSLRRKHGNWPKREDGYSYAGWIHECPKRFEVIGNIYENPDELIGKTSPNLQDRIEKG